MSTVRDTERGQEGFSLIELLVVISIMGILSAAFIVSFSKDKSTINQTISFVLSRVRDAQTKAVTSAKFKEASEGLPAAVSRCGFGLTDSSATTFIMYAGPNASDPAVNCATQDRRYGAVDKIVETITLPDSNIEFKNMSGGPGFYFYDIFYEPPTPVTYLDNNPSQAGSAVNPARMVLGPVGTDCVTNPAPCRAICVYASGKIELPVSLTCPGI